MKSANANKPYVIYFNMGVLGKGATQGLTAFKITGVKRPRESDAWWSSRHGLVYRPIKVELLPDVAGYCNVGEEKG